jgi:hypothetical protein
MGERVQKAYLLGILVELVWDQAWGRFCIEMLFVCNVDTRDLSGILDFLVKKFCFH